MERIGAKEEEFGLMESLSQKTALYFQRFFV